MGFCRTPSFLDVPSVATIGNILILLTSKTYQEVHSCFRPSCCVAVWSGAQFDHSISSYLLWLIPNWPLSQTFKLHGKSKLHSCYSTAVISFVYSWLRKFITLPRATLQSGGLYSEDYSFNPNCTKASCWCVSYTRTHHSKLLQCAAERACSSHFFNFFFPSSPPHLPPSLVWRVLANLAKFPPKHMLNPNIRRPVSGVTHEHKHAHKHAQKHSVSAFKFPQKTCDVYTLHIYVRNYFTWWRACVGHYFHESRFFSLAPE